MSSKLPKPFTPQKDDSQAILNSLKRAQAKFHSANNVSKFKINDFISKISYIDKAKPKIFAPSYLYLRGNVYYFRYVFPIHYHELFKHKEIRISLQTGFLRSAKSIAKQLIVILEDSLMNDNQNIKSYDALRTKLVNKVKEKLHENSTQQLKKGLDIRTIRHRMDLALQKMLDSADMNLYQPPNGILSNGNQELISTSASDSLGHQINLLNILDLKNPDSFNVDTHLDSILQILQDQILTLDEISDENIKIVLKEYLKLQINFKKIMLARENADYAYEKQFLPQQPIYLHIESPHENKNKLEPQISAKVGSTLLLSELIEKHIEIKLKDGRWQPHTVPDRRNRVENLLQILGDKPVDQITREDMRRFRDILCKLPANRTRDKKYKNLNIAEILALENVQPMSVSNVNIIIEGIATMFSWGIREGIISNNPAQSLQVKDDRQVIELRNAFTADDLKKIFFSGDYLEKNFIKPAYYWVPLISLYTGMRLEEICQLHCSDIIQENSLVIFDINEYKSSDGSQIKRLKTKNSMRLIPVHSDLLKRGFIKFFMQVKDQGHERLFPELNRTEKTPKFGKQVSKKFTDLLKKKGIEGNKSFHSLRHTFSDYFKKLDMHNDIFRQVFGHEGKTLAGRQYGDKFSPLECYSKLISKLRYEKK